MGYYVHLNVTFACDSNDGVAKVAKKYLIDSGYDLPDDYSHWPEYDYKKEYLISKEASWFLCDLAKRIGNNPGPKGGLSTWGIVGNYTDVDDFVDSLKEFWFTLLTEDIPGGPHNFEHIIVLYEMEQSEQACAYEIYMDDRKNNIENLIIKHHKLPFAWMQF